MHGVHDNPPHHHLDAVDRAYFLRMLDALIQKYRPLLLADPECPDTLRRMRCVIRINMTEIPSGLVVKSQSAFRKDEYSERNVDLFEQMESLDCPAVFCTEIPINGAETTFLLCQTRFNSSLEEIGAATSRTT